MLSGVEAIECEASGEVVRAADFGLSADSGAAAAATAQSERRQYRVC